MTKYNVKKIENTNTMITALSTTCKKQTTAVNRFARFLETYDSCFTETMLKCFMNIKPVGYVSGELISQATIEENEYTMCVQISDNTYIISIEFKHNDNTSNINETTTDSTNETSNNTTESDTNNDTASTSNNATNTNETTTDNTTKTDTTTNINNMLESLGNKQLIRKYVDGINNGLQKDNYKQTRECFCKLVQILPDGYEICFTTKFNVDMTIVDEAIYNHRYKIIRDKTGIMFNIHKYSEVEHKFKPMLSSMKITDIPLYIYHRTFDSVCCVFKHDSTLEIITKLEKLFDTAEKYRNCYTWNKDNGNAQQREWKEKHDSIDKFEWYDNGDKYTAEYTVQISRYNVYAYGAYTKNGKKTTLTAIKNSYKRLLQAVQRE